MASFIFPMWKVFSSLVYILFRIKHSTNSIQLMLFNQKTQLRTLKGGCTLQIKETPTLLGNFCVISCMKRLWFKQPPHGGFFVYDI